MAHLLCLNGKLYIQNSKALKPIYKGVITNIPATVQMAAGFYLVTTYRSGGYKISSLSLVNIQAQNGSLLKHLLKVKIMIPPLI